jgi:hypothetical protein
MCPLADINIPSPSPVMRSGDIRQEETTWNSLARKGQFRRAASVLRCFR